MILACWNYDWYLAEGAPGVKGCGLRLRKAAIPPAGFDLYRYGTFWHKYFPVTDEITFYPELRYRGCKVTPESWHLESVEPIVKCLLMPEDLDTEAMLGIKDLAAWARPKYMREAGWEWDPRDGGTKYIHVDDLEKIEGPPPKGAF